ncbi:DUF943 family protein [Erwinia sp. 198]|uniref:DUF943 family protein n=1 Tax=Erwinia sp. 198 TaxID=2022746 RepID=UPI000F67E9A8|nr:DUF943 family protein [Erwinia sp. 198]RRZ87838.1 DUF943 family protein [Erwinia sp. 198]
MKANLKKIAVALVITSCALTGYFWWLTSRPVKIIAVHQEDNFSEILVKNFPFTDKGKINWWLANKDSLKIKYNIPCPSSSGNFYVNFWDYGEGYKEKGKYDRRCFDDMNTVKNCIDKNAVFSVENNRKKEILFRVYDGRYRMEKNGNKIKLKDE